MRLARRTLLRAINVIYTKEREREKKIVLRRRLGPDGRRREGGGESGKEEEERRGWVWDGGRETLNERGREKRRGEHTTTKVVQL